MGNCEVASKVVVRHTMKEVSGEQVLFFPMANMLLLVERVGGRAGICSGGHFCM